MSGQDQQRFSARLSHRIKSILLSVLRVLFFRKKKKRSVTGEPSDDMYTLF